MSFSLCCCGCFCWSCCSCCSCSAFVAVYTCRKCTRHLTDAEMWIKRKRRTHSHWWVRVDMGVRSTTPTAVSAIWAMPWASRLDAQPADELALQRSWLLTVANICIGSRAAPDAGKCKQHKANTANNAAACNSSNMTLCDERSRLTYY